MIEIKQKVNKSALMREIKAQAIGIYENSSESYEKTQAFIAGAESFFDLLRLPVVIEPVTCENCYGFGYTVDENGRRKEHCKECE